MVKVITYGTYDLLHYGHIRLLERAKALGDYLIVGITADGFDLTRGKINVQQSLMERIDAVKATGIADEIIVEEYEGQKIDDIQRYNVDIFTVGSDWVGKFDYLKQYCKVVYLDRTEGVSSSEIRAEKRLTRLGLVGESNSIEKFYNESNFVNGVSISGICTKEPDMLPDSLKSVKYITDNYDRLLETVDAVYLVSNPFYHYEQIKKAISAGKHVLCETPIAIDSGQCKELFEMARKNNVVLTAGNKTAYTMAYSRLLLMVKTGKIGDVVSVDATCTSLSDAYFMKEQQNFHYNWNSITAWGAKALLPVFQILGTGYIRKQISSLVIDEEKRYDTFSKIDFIYPHAVASVKAGKAIKSEGELIISGTKGYIYVPAPWWKMDYFEIRFENSSNNQRYFYQLDGEGIRYEIVAFINAIENRARKLYVEEDVSMAIAKVMEDYYKNKDIVLL